MFSEIQLPVNQQVFLPQLDQKEIQLFIKREDQIHQQISGNKYRKLKYNLREAKGNGYKRLLTFGGAYSNHILATAIAGKISGFKTIGIIRGNELGRDIYATLSQNPTLSKAAQYGMQFVFISREDYRKKMNTHFLKKMNSKFGSFFVIPEGGTNELAVKGCQEILTEEDKQFDYICCCVGTGGTMAGLIKSSKKHQNILGFSALKGNFLKDEIGKYAAHQNNWKLMMDYHFGGYGKYSDALITFINEFRKTTAIPLDPIYTGKMMFGIKDMLKKHLFPRGAKILAVHTGGLQGIVGFNQRLKNKGSNLRIEI